jgi:hypothetical protein
MMELHSANIVQVTMKGVQASSVLWANICTNHRFNLKQHSEEYLTYPKP